MRKEVVAASSVAKSSRPYVLSLRRNFFWTLIGNVIYATCQWGMLVVLAKLTNPETVGNFALSLALTAPVIMFANLQLRSIQATDARSEYTFADYLGLRLLCCLGAMFVIICVTTWGKYNQGTLMLIIIIIGLSKVVESISDIFHGLFQRYEHMDKIGIAKCVKGITSLFALAIGVYWGGLLLGTLGLLASWLLVLLTYEISSGSSILRLYGFVGDHSLRPKIEIRKIVKLSWLTLPLGFSSLLLSLNENIPRLLIADKLGKPELGIFAAMVYIPVAGTTVVRALTFAGAPRLARFYAEEDHAGYIKLLIQMTLLGALLGLVGLIIVVFAGQEILGFIYSAEYARYADVFSWLMAAAMMHYIAMFLESGLIVLRSLRAVMFITIAALIITTVSCFILVPHYQLLGAAWAIGISASIHAVTLICLMMYLMKSKQRAAFDSL